MNFIDQLKAIPDLTEEQCVRINAVVTNALSPDALPRTASYIRICVHRPSRLTQKMCAVNEIMNYYGHEVTTVGMHGTWYVNAGDVYATTVLNVDGTWKVSTLGDVIEELERTLQGADV